MRGSRRTQGPLGSLLLVRMPQSSISLTAPYAPGDIAHYGNLCRKLVSFRFCQNNEQPRGLTIIPSNRRLLAFVLAPRLIHPLCCSISLLLGKKSIAKDRVNMCKPCASVGLLPWRYSAIQTSLGLKGESSYSRA
jgi:hypothetical protein